MFQESRRIAYYVIGGALITVAILLFAIYLIVQHDREMKIEGTEDSVKALAVALSKEADATLYVAELALLRISEYLNERSAPLSIESRDLHDLLVRNRQLLRRAEFSDSFGHLFILREDGSNVANSVSFPVTQVDASDRPYFQFHKTYQSNTIYISQPMDSKVTQERRVFLTLRLDDSDGNFMGVVGVHFNLDHFNSMYSQLGLPPSGAVTILRTDGSGIFRYPASDTFYDDNLSQEGYFQEMLNDRFGTVHVLSPFDEQHRIAGYKVSDKYPLISIISFTENSILSHWRVNASVVVLVFLAVSTVLILVILYVRRQVSSIIRLTDLSTHDPLTGLWNRRAFDEKLEDEWRRARRRGYGLTVLFIDIDFFKNYNDTYGHQAGDACLKQVAKLLAGQFGRAGEQVSRYGGEEFVVLLPAVPAEDATPLAQKVVDGVKSEKIAHTASAISKVVTVSVGVATGTPQEYLSAVALVEAADDALYAAKSNGRDQVAVSQSSV